MCQEYQVIGILLHARFGKKTIIVLLWIAYKDDKKKKKVFFCRPCHARAGLCEAPKVDSENAIECKVFPNQGNKFASSQYDFLVGGRFLSSLAMNFLSRGYSRRAYKSRVFVNFLFSLAVSFIFFLQDLCVLWALRKEWSTALYFLSIRQTGEVTLVCQSSYILITTSKVFQ